MLLSRDQFNVLRYIAELQGKAIWQDMADVLKISITDLLSIIGFLKQNKWLDDDCQMTSIGWEVLEPYRVNNAIILAAGMSTRFVPVSYELPKGLISVKGDILVERLITQLQEAGIKEIVLVVGYMMEKFLYLRNKFNVKLVVNNEFATKNTHSSIYAARDYLANTYVCCSDNYYPNNMFHQYEYRAFYCSVFLEGTSYVERAFTFDQDGLIYDTNKPSHDQWIMYGHAYYDKVFTERFKPILESYYGRPGIEYMYWETIYAENVKNLPMYIKKCTSKEILEFDSMEELEAFDPGYIANNKVKVFENICKILCCEVSDITDIKVIKKGLNNRSFKFLCNGKCYVYRHPGINASNVIDRKKEASSLRVAKRLGIDKTLIYVDEEEGWKISRYIETSEDFDFANKEHVSYLASHLKLLHQAGTKVGFGFSYQEEADRLIDIERCIDGMSYRRLTAEREQMKPVFELLESDPWQISLCHNDIYEPNLLLKDSELHLIDWEFAGDADIGYDICKLFSVVNPEIDKMDEYLYAYFGRNTTKCEKIHLIACAAVIYYYWFVWGVYISKNGEQVSEYLMTWYDKMIYFRNGVLNMNRVGGEEMWKF